jgi:hypothetical protein
MSVDELNVTVEPAIKEISITVADELPSTELIVQTIPDVIILASGNMGPAGSTGPMGPQGQWIALTQVEDDALDPPDPEVLYVIIG